MQKYIVAVVFLLSLAGVRAHSITVDGDPSDWVGIGADTAVVDSGEWIVEDAINDDWGDAGDAPYAADNPEPYSYPTGVADHIADIQEVRYTVDINLAGEGGYFYGLVKMSNLTSNTIVTILLNMGYDGGSVTTYDSSDIVSALPWQIMIKLYNGQIRVCDSLGNPINDVPSQVAFNTTNGVIEFGIPTDNLPEPQGMTLLTAIYAGVTFDSNFVEVDSLASNLAGGGGTNTVFDPDVYDVVAPDSATQTVSLYSYSDTSRAVLQTALFYPINLMQIMPYMPVSIYEIQSSGDTSLYNGMTVLTWGAVTGVYSNGFTMQEMGDSGQPGAWSGIFVYTGSSPNVSRGYFVNLVGQVTEYYGFTEIINVDTIVVVDTGNYISPIVLPTGQVPQEQWEGVLVQVDSAVCTNPDLGYGEWEVNDGSGPVRVDDRGYGYSPDSGHIYRVIGPVFYTYGNYKLEPRDSADVMDLTSPPPVPSGILINEVYYDAPGSDHGTFTELFGEPGTSLDGVYLVGINGANGQIYRSIDLSGHTINQNGYFVIAQDTTVPNADMVTNDVDWQNGPDNVALISISGNDTILLDAVGYGPEDTSSWHFAGFGIPVVDVRSGYSLSRIPDGVNTNCNACDFAVTPPTPGQSNGMLLFQDGFENGASNWSGDWGVTQQTSHTGNYSYTDSPNGNYPNNANLIGELTLSFDLSNFAGAYLQFYHAHWIEQGFDYGFVEVSTDNGTTWTTVATYTGDLTSWTFENIDLGQFCGNHMVRIRFRLTSDAGYTEDGWFVDDVKIIGTHVDASPPFIIHNPIPDTTSVLDSIVLSARYMDASGIPMDSLYYTIDNNSYAITSDSSSNGEYFYTVRGLTPGAFLSYHFVAIDMYGNRAQSDEFSHIAGDVLYHDDDDPGYITLPDPGDSMAVKFDSIPADSVWITTLLYNFYMDSNHDLDSVSVHVWDSLGNDLISPRTIYPSNTPDAPFRWTAIDIRDENLYIPGNTPFYVGVVFRDTIPAIMLDSPGSFNSSYRYANGEWHLLGVDLFIRAVAGVYGTGISENPSGKLTFRMLQNVPNPVKGRTVITFTLPKTEKVKLSLYDVSGRLIRTIANGEFSSGTHSVTLNTTGLKSGVYFYELRAGNDVMTKKMVILK